MAHVVNEVQATSQIRSRLTMVLAIAVIAVMVTLLALAGAFASGTAESGAPNVAPSIDLSGKVANIH